MAETFAVTSCRVLTNVMLQYMNGEALTKEVVAVLDVS